jgi:GPH family glycoside/pentoside/hexuronide:cation symporter
MSVSAPATDPSVPAAEPRPPLDATLAPPSANHAARSAKLGFGALAVYGSGALVENVTTVAIGSLLLFYLTVVCGLSGTEAGFALGATLFVDATFDPVVGSVSDNSRSPRGRRHPFMLAAIVPVVIAFGMLFSAPKGLSPNLLFAYALTTLLTLRIALSFFVVPYMALGAELSDDYAERSTIVASRVLFTVVGGLLANYLIWGIFLKGPHGRFVAAAYSPLAWSMGAIVLFGGLLAAVGTLRARGRLHAAAAGAKFSPNQFFVELLEVFRNGSFRSLFLCCLILFAALGAAGALTLHANTFFWKLSAVQILMLGFVAPVGLLAGVFAAAMLARVMEKRWIAMLGLALIGVAQLGPVALRLAHVIGPALYVPVLAAAVVLGGFGGSVATISFQSMMADAADEHEHLFGARREGLYFAGITFSAKASSGLGAMIGGIALDVIGFPHGVAATPAMLAAIPASTIRNLGIVYGPGAAIFTAVSVVILLGFRLTKADHARILGELRSRRAAA